MRECAAVAPDCELWAGVVLACVAGAAGVVELVEPLGELE
jgi:hypothetical protein